jgi:hypothetical protein
MKKFSTAALLLALAPSLYAATAAAAQGAAAQCAFRDNAPDQHVVVRGDTLWGISGKFLEHPWCWPQVWGMNREQIKNPHWIYPGQTVYLDRASGRLRLGKPVDGSADGIPTTRLAPQLRTEGLGQKAVSSIPANDIEPFLSQPLVVEKDQLEDTPRIIATEEGRVVVGKSDKVYVRGDLRGGTSFQVFRPATPLKDPDTGEVIAYEAAYLGTIKLDQTTDQPDGAHIFHVVSVKQEITTGDRLLPVPPTPILNYVPHPPETELRGRIVSIYGGVSQAGQNQIVAINRGKRDGIDIGTVLELSRFGRVVTDRTDKNGSWFSGGSKVKLPDEDYGNVFMFRVFDRISYGLIMQVTDTVKVGDVVHSPQ